MKRQGVTPQGKAITLDHQRLQDLEARAKRLNGRSPFKKGYRALDVVRDRTYEVIDHICGDESIELICVVMPVRTLGGGDIGFERMALRSCIHELFVERRSSAGGRPEICTEQK